MGRHHLRILSESGESGKTNQLHERIRGFADSDSVLLNHVEPEHFFHLIVRDHSALKDVILGQRMSAFW
jgi:hypothetical protein